MKSIYDGFTFVTGLSLNNPHGTYTVGKNKEDYTADFYGLERGEGINFSKLLSYLKSNRKTKLYYGHFRGTPINERKAVSRYGIVEIGRVLNKTIPFT